MEEDEELFNSGDEEKEDADDDSLADDFDDALDLQDVLEADLEVDQGVANADAEADFNANANAAPQEDEVGEVQAQQSTRTDHEADHVNVEAMPPVIPSTAATSNTGLSDGDDDDEDEETDELAKKPGGNAPAAPQMSKKDKRRAKERRKKEEQEAAAKNGTGAVSHRATAFVIEATKSQSCISIARLQRLWRRVSLKDEIIRARPR